jgi:A nuclease family of the HNH/ENDO VII superfamily with conserved AHH
LPVRVLGGLLENLMLKRPSDILGENLEAAGYTRPDDSAAHHMVPEGDKRANNLKIKLGNLGIDINSADNGVFLPQVPGSTAPGAYHPKLNNTKYHDQLQLDFEGVNSKNDALDVLGRIRGQLLNGTYPGSKPVPTKKP